MNVPHSERGAALLSILLLVAILSVIAATTLDRVILSTKLSGNGQSTRQARMLAYAAEEIALARIADLRAANSTQTTLEGGWLGQPRRFQLPGGIIRATLHDGGNCFNLNSLVQGSEGKFVVNPAGRDQFVALMTVMGIPDNAGRLIASASVDWTDSDSEPQPGGAEDGDYQALNPAYLPANGLFAHKSELRGVKHVTPAIYEKLSPLVCALPVTQLSPLNVNTLSNEEAPLLAMLYPPGAMTANRTRAMIAERPSNGYGSLMRFWELVGNEVGQPAQTAKDQIRLASSWFRLELQINSGDVEIEEMALIAAETAPPRILWRSWGEAG